MKKYHKDTFEKISEEKRNKILTVGLEEFANLGYTNSNINVIADKAGVSVGSLYKYFDNKEGFFLAVLNIGLEELERTLNVIFSSDKEFYDKIEMILRVIPESSRKQSNMIKLYNELTSESNSEIAKRVSNQMESLTGSIYAQMIQQAKVAGIAAPDIDENVFAFCMDNLFLTLQFSYTCDYYKERKRIYLGDTKDQDDELIISQYLKFIKNAFSG